MSESKTENYLPEEGDATNAFNTVNLRYGKVADSIDKIRNLPHGEKRGIATDYLTVGVGYFASHEDDYLRRVGTTILDAINTGRLELATDKVRKLNTGEPQLGIEFSSEKASLIMPLEFIVLARKQPVVALASILGTFSRIVDFLNKPPLDSGLVEEKAEATQAHFLKGVGVHPEITSDPDCIRVLAKYPNGIFSLVKSVL